MTQRLSRRSALAALALTPGAYATGLASSTARADESKPKGNIKQSICRWCYNRIKLETLAEEAKKLGYQSIELLVPKEFLQIKDSGLTCAILGGANIANGLNRKENHDRIVKRLTDYIEFAAEHKIPHVITMAGNRRGLDDEAGMKMCAVGLKRILGLAEQKKVNVVMEGLNSKVDHKDHMYDKTEWGVALCKMVGSERFKLLYDIYHMQIMEGDVIATIRKHKDCIAHYHTGGVPGRNEIDQTQELNYSAIVKAIVATGYKGYLGQEFIPRRKPLESLAEAFRICDV
jgi:hydroxypyruvate isomerase